MDHAVIHFERNAPWIPVLAHVLAGEPDSTPGVKPEAMLRRDMRCP
jgi:hypothetical protein